MNWLTATNSSKIQVNNNEENIIERIKELQNDNYSTYERYVILLNEDIEKEFIDLMIWKSVLNTSREAKTIMWIEIIKFNLIKIVETFNQTCKKYDKIILFTTLKEFFLIDTDKYLQLINNTWNKNY